MSPANQSWKTNKDRGQAAILLMVCLSLCLLVALAFSLDYTNLWFHQKKAQAAADASCLAAATDMLVTIAGGTTNSGFTVGTPGTCASGTPTGTICHYASFNGYSPVTWNSNAPSNQISWSFPASNSIPGVTPPSSSITSHPFIQVTIAENVQTYINPLLTGGHYQTVAASAKCGLVSEYAGGPITVLNPTVSGALTYSGGGQLVVVGGPPRSIIVNSSSSTAINCQPSAWIDTSQGGPNFTGSDVGTVGGPVAAPNATSGQTCPGGGWREAPPVHGTGLRRLFQIRMPPYRQQVA